MRWLLLLVFPGCVSQVDTQPFSRPSVHCAVSPDFANPDEVVEGIAAWEPEFRCDVYIGRADPSPSTIGFAPVADPPDRSGRIVLGLCWYHRVTIREPMVKGYATHRVVSHELGHALGLPHDMVSSEESVMHPYSADDTDAPSDLDRDRVSMMGPQPLSESEWTARVLDGNQ